MGKNKGEMGETYVVLNEILNNKTAKTIIFGNDLTLTRTDDVWSCEGKLIDMKRLEKIKNDLAEEIVMLKTRGGVAKTSAMLELKDMLGESISAPASKPDIIIDGQEYSVKSLTSKSPDYICYTTNGYFKYKLDITDTDYNNYLDDLNSTNKTILGKAHNPLKYFNDQKKTITFIGPCVDKTATDLAKIDPKMTEILGKIIFESRISSKSVVSDILTKDEAKIFEKFNYCVEKGFKLTDKCEFDFNNTKNAINIPTIFLDKKLNVKKCNNMGNEFNICDILYSDKAAFSKRATGKVQGLVVYKENNEYFVNDCLYLRFKTNKIFQELHGI